MKAQFGTSGKTGLKTLHPNEIVGIPHPLRRAVRQLPPAPPMPSAEMPEVPHPLIRVARQLPPVPPKPEVPYPPP